MKIILQEEIENVGHIGDMIDVKQGFARNFLLPRGKAIEATTRNLKQLEHAKRLVADKAKKAKGETEAFARTLVEMSITITVAAGPDGKLFGSVSGKDITEALAEQGIQLDKRKVTMEHPLKEVGSFVIPIKLPNDVTASLTVNIAPETPEE
ncbi:MAG TPA: 50S ribosomal protein L9 [Nitrospirales bacterium]|jgi:large subunit ribosomal protein L9|nr:50S ribosomal protein L9 [Nitrospirales bacterium]